MTRPLYCSNDVSLDVSCHWAMTLSYLLRAIRWKNLAEATGSQHQLGKWVGLEGPEGKIRDEDHSVRYKDQLQFPSCLLTFVHVWLFHISIRKQIDWGLSSPLKKVRSSKHFKAGDLAESLCTFSMYNKGRVGESTYFSTKTSGFIRVSSSRKAKGNKTQRNTNKDSRFQPFKYTGHTLVVYTEKKEMCILHISVNQHSHPLRPLINHLVVRQPCKQGVHPSSLLDLLWISGVVW